MARKRWCNECGGFASKWRTTDRWFRAHYLRERADDAAQLRRTWPYNAVVFAEELGQPARLGRLLESIGLAPKRGTYSQRPDSVTQATSRDLPSTTGQRRAYV